MIIVYECEALSRLFCSYSMRAITIFVLLYRELLKQKLQTKVFKLLRTNQHFYFFIKAIANVNTNNPVNSKQLGKQFKQDLSSQTGKKWQYLLQIREG